MKFKKAIKFLLVLILIGLLNFSMVFHWVKAMDINVANIQSGGDCGSLLTYKGVGVKVDYAYYVDKGVSYPAYCLDKTKQGVNSELSYCVSIEDKIHDLILWRYMVNGYPYQSYQSLGCANKEEAFTATKQAIYCYLHGNQVNDYSPIGEAGQRTLQAMKQIIEKAQNSTETQIANTFSIQKNGNEFTVDQNEPNYVAKTYQIIAKTDFTNYQVTLENKDQELLEGIKVTNLQNQEKTEFAPNENFKIMIPISQLTTDGEFTIKVKTTVKTKPIFYGKAPNTSYQDYALTAATYEDCIQTVSEQFTKNKTELWVKKIDENTKEPLNQVWFDLLNEKKETVFANLVTNEKGEFQIQGLQPGIYYLKETKTKQGYVISDELICMKLEYGQILTVTINNQKEQKPSVTLEQSHSEKTIRKLPVTGY